MNKLAQSYGLSVGEGVGDATIELVMAFEPRLRESAAHRGRYYHLRRAIDLLWNEPRRVRGGKEYDPRKHDAYIWNEWSEQLMRMFCEHKVRTITGPNSSSKSTSAALYHLCAWLASPSNSLVIVTSTDRLGLKARFWREVTKYYRMLPPEYMFGNLVQSDIALQTRKGDYDAGLFGVATGQDNDVDKAVAKIVGRHNTYTYAVVDEMQATNEGLVKGAISLEAGSDNFEFTGLGNAQSELDPHGTMSEPKAGWDSISDDDEMWETKTGVCLHLDGLRCPRVLEGDQYYPGLLRREHIENTIRDFGEDSPEFWSTRRGFWAPQGVTKTVLTVADVEKFRAKDKAIFAGKYIWGAALDPAYEGGDRCVLRFGREGEFDDGVVGMELTETIVIKVKATDEFPLHYQITYAVRDECEKRGIDPKMFAIDTTGEGGGLAAIMMREWSRNIYHVEFGGKPTDRPISPDDRKPADKEYYNRVSELWFWFRVLVRRGMIRGLDIDTLREFCQRRWKMKGMYKMVEPKEEMKLRTHRSPDFADAAVVLAELFHERGHLNPSRIKSETSMDWSQLAKRYNNVQSGYLINA